MFAPVVVALIVNVYICAAGGKCFGISKLSVCYLYLCLLSSPAIQGFFLGEAVNLMQFISDF